MKRSDLALAALASAAVPGMKPVAVAGMAVDESVADLQQAVVEDATGRRWLVRSPLTAVAGARLQRNDELVRQLSRHVPFKVPAPVGYAPAGQEGSAAVYPHVEGMTLDLARLPGGPGLAHAVGRAIAAVHNIPRAAFEHHDVPVFDAAGCRQRLIAEVDRAAETGRVPTRLLARWEEAFDAAPLWQFATTPVHGAFRGATVLVAFSAHDDADSGRVVAVTDWDEAMIADPAVDLAELYAQAPPDAWESVLDSYALARAQRPDPYLHARARLISETRRLRGLARAVAEGEEETARRAVEALRRTDRLTEDADSLVPTTARAAGSVGSGGRTDQGGDAPGNVSTSVASRQPSAPDPDVTAEVPIVAVPSAQGADRDPQSVTPVQDEASSTSREEPSSRDASSPLPADGASTAEPEPNSDSAPEPGPDPQPDSNPAPDPEHDPQHDSGHEAEAEMAVSDAMDDDDRLHELYGMPSEEPADASARDAGGGDVDRHSGDGDHGATDDDDDDHSGGGPPRSPSTR